MTSSGVTLDRAAFGYRDTSFLFDHRFPAGRVTAVMGPSGAGKTTLLHLVAGFERPRAGRVMIGNTDVTLLPPDRRPVSMVFQENNLFAHLSVEQNVGLGLDPGLRLSARQRAAVSAALDRVGLADKGKRLPRELSGGERSRVALARAALRDRPVLLLDEPFAALGPALRQSMLSIIDALRREGGLTVLFVTHQPEDAEAIADEVLFLEQKGNSLSGNAANFFGPLGPSAFRAYIGAAAAKPDRPAPLPKPT
ncbi:MAG: ATP-binding cassette domain-containing protein [Methylobacterium mesophilicum]|nr:ATP-binding cassette domain-containing protein [Methylobacterium mesophilicum]